MFSRFPRQRELLSWYPPFPVYNSLLLRLRHLGLYRDDHLDFNEMMDSHRKARGKGPPRKGLSMLTIMVQSRNSLGGGGGGSKTLTNGMLGTQEVNDARS